METQLESVLSLTAVKAPEKYLAKKFLTDLSRRFGLLTFVETGTYLGDSAGVAADVFDEIHSIELSKELAAQATARFASKQHVHIYQGDSAQRLPEILNRLKSPALFWLDGHYSSGMTAKGSVNTPVLDELQSIHARGPSGSVLLIDDLRLFDPPKLGTGVPQSIMGYPTMKALYGVLTVMGYQLVIFGDVGLAVPSQFNCEFSSLLKALTASRLYDGTNLTIEEIIQAEKAIVLANGKEREVLCGLCGSYNDVECFGLGLHYRFWQGLSLLRDNHYLKAVEEFRRVMDLGFTHWRLKWYLALVLQQLNEYEAAAGLLQALIKDEPNFIPARELLFDLSKKHTAASRISCSTTASNSECAGDSSNAGNPVAETLGVEEGSISPLGLQDVPSLQDSLQHAFVCAVARRFGTRTLVAISAKWEANVTVATDPFDRVFIIGPASEDQKSAEIPQIPKIHVRRGNSIEVLPSIFAELTGPVLFCLEAQEIDKKRSGHANTAVLQDLEIILKQKQDAVLLIKNLRFLEVGRSLARTGPLISDCLSLTEVYRHLSSADFEFYVFGDLGLAFPKSMPCEVSPFVMALTLDRLYDGQNLSIEEVIEAEKVIAQTGGRERENLRRLCSPSNSTAPLISELQYRFWHALTLVGENNLLEAARQFVQLAESGFNHWRLKWYLALIMHRLGDGATAQAVLDELIHQVPNFIPAHQLRKDISAPRVLEAEKARGALSEQAGIVGPGTCGNAGVVAESSLDSRWAERLSKIRIWPDGDSMDRIGYDNDNPSTNGEHSLLSHLVCSGDTILDVGANIGNWSCQALACASDVTLHAFEPLLDTFASLERNLCHTAARLHPFAMSDRIGEKTFHYFACNPEYSGMNSCYRRPEIEQRLKVPTKQITVKTQTLQEFCRQTLVDRVDVLKIDVEGSELDVLFGARELLEQHRIGLIQFEYGNTYQDARITLRQVFDLLSGYNYTLYRVIPTGLIHLPCWRSALENFRYSNYLAVASTPHRADPTADPIVVHELRQLRCIMTMRKSETTAVDSAELKPALRPGEDPIPVLKKRGLWLSGHPLKLHLGCGENRFAGYVNVDYPPSEHTVQSRQGADVFGDITRLAFPAGSVDEVRLHHVFEHFVRAQALALLIHWHEWLKVGGVLLIETPDVMGCSEQLLADLPYRTKQAVMRHAFGSHEAHWANHYDGWHAQKFENVLGRLGFNTQCRRWRWPHEPHLANVDARATKIRSMRRSELLQAADSILEESMVAEVPSERAMWEVWRKRLREFLELATVLDPGRQPAPTAEAVKSAPSPDVHSRSAAPVVVVKLQGGLGNQMFQYAAGLALARRTQAELKLDLCFLLDRTPRPNFTYRDYCLDLFNLAPDCEALKDGAALAQRLPKSVENQFCFDPQFCQLGADVYLDGYWQSPKYFESVQDEVRRTFTSFVSPLTPEQQALAQEISSCESVCLNVRRADYLTNPLTHAWHGLCHESYFHEAVAWVRKRVPGARFFVFSDDIEWCRSANLVANAPVRFVSHDFAGDRFGAYLQLMTRCTHFILPNSSFGWWAAFLGTAPHKIVVVPDPWFDDPSNDTSDLLPRTWVRLPKNGPAKPTVSVVISCHNYAAYLREAVESVLQQTYREFEIVIVDDGSTDESLALAKQLAAQHGADVPIRVFHLEDVGPSAARRFGVMQSRGRYYLPLDADDRIAAEFLVKTVPILDADSELGFVYVDTAFFGDVQEHQHQPEYDFKALCQENFISYCSLVRKAAFDEVGGYDPENWGYYEDWDLWIRLGGAGWQGRHLAAPLFFYRHHFDSSLSLFSRRLGPIYKAFLIDRHPELHSAEVVSQARTLLQGMPSGWSRRPPLRRIHELRALLAQNHQNPHVKFFLALALAKEGQVNEPVALLRSILDCSAEDREAENLLAQLLAAGEPPLVSVIVPTYNRPLLLREALCSILAQSFKDFEIIVVNDAGCEVDSIIKPLKLQGRILSLRHEVNRGLGAARNTGVRAARGRYIAYLDDDDRFYPQHLQTLVDFLRAHPGTVAYTDALRARQEHLQGRWIVTQRELLYSHDWDNDKILMHNFVPVLCFMHEKAFLEKSGFFDESLDRHEDWDLWIRLSRHYPFAHIRTVTCEFSHRTDGSSMTSQGAERFLATMEQIHARYASLTSGRPDLIEGQRVSREGLRAQVARPAATPPNAAEHRLEPGNGMAKQNRAFVLSNQKTGVNLFAAGLKPKAHPVQPDATLPQTTPPNPPLSEQFSSSPTLSPQDSLKFEQIACPFCGSNGAYAFRRSADIVRCAACSTVYLRTRLKGQILEQIYQTYADEGSHMRLPKSLDEARSSGLKRDYFLQEILQFTTAEGRLLDVGCGWGAFLLNGREHGFEPAGVELTRKAVQYASNQLHIPVVNTQFLDTPYEPDSFQVVTMNHVLEHLTDPRAALEKIYRILKPDGLFCGIVPNIDSFCANALGEKWYWLDPNYHYVHYAPATLQKHLKAAGFQVERLYTVTGDYGTDPIREAAVKLDPELVETSRFADWLKKVELAGQGEELRFFARKPIPTSSQVPTNLIRKSDRLHLVLPSLPGPSEPLLVDTTPAAVAGPTFWAAKSTQDPSVSIIIPVFNQVGHTRNCIKCIFAVPCQFPFEVIIVDNNSTDDTEAFCRGLLGSQTNFRYVRLSENKGFGPACNKGAEFAKGESLVFLNNDTEPEAGWLEAGVKRLQSDSTIGIVGAKLLYPDRTVQHCGIEFFRGVNREYAIWPLHRHLRVAQADPSANQEGEVAAVTGACLFIGKANFQQVKGFSPEYPMYFEDTDLCFKVRQTGRKIFFEPKSVVIHYEGQSSPNREHIDALNKESAKIFFKKWDRELLPLEMETAVERTEGRFCYLSQSVLPELPRGDWNAQSLSITAKSLARVLVGMGPFYMHFGGAGDALLLLATFLDKHPDAQVVSYPNSIPAMRSFFEAFPSLRRVIFLPKNSNPSIHLLLRMMMKEVPTFQGMGATPRMDYWKEWHAKLNIFKEYKIARRPAWAQAFRTSPQAKQVVLAPKGSLVGMAGSKRNMIDPEVWPALIDFIRESGGSPVIIGTPDERELYPCPAGCEDHRSYSFRDQLECVAKSAALVGTDSWAKTYSALVGIPTIVFDSLRGADWEGKKDPSDHVFVDPWESITAVKDLAGFRDVFTHKVKLGTPSPSPAWKDKASRNANARLRVAWEGTYLDFGSLSYVNRELTRCLSHSPQLRLTRVGEPSLRNGAAGCKELQQLSPLLSKTSPADCQVTVRHSWPPNWTAKHAGPLAVIQPWEFGALPQEWVRQSEQVQQFWVPSNYVRNVYISSGVPGEKVKVVPNGIDPDKFHPKATPMRLETKKSFKFLFVGGTIHRKGADVLLETYLNSFTAADDVCLVIKDFGGKTVYAGQTLEARILAARAKPGTPEILYLNKELSPEVLPSLYTACDCLVHPYRGEGFGLPILEAMACGLSVIVTAGGAADDFATEAFAYRIPATRRTIGDTISGMKLTGPGWLLEPDSSELALRMNWILDHRGEARELGARASEYARREWTWEKAARIAAERLHELTAATTQKASAVPAPEQSTKSVAMPLCGLVGHLGKARETFTANKPKEAWELVTSALRARPYHPEGFLMLAEIAASIGDGQTARNFGERARALAPTWKPARQFMNRRLKGASRPAWMAVEDVLKNAAPRLTVCIIAKNEERFIGQCLSSIKPIAGQLVVVDTGSMDRTVEIAKSFGAEVHHFDWCDDFSAARNAALEHARGDWVLILDADEELPSDQHARLLADLKNPKAVALRLPLINKDQEAEGHSFVPRLFRNAPGVYFTGRIHEQVFPNLVALGKIWGLGTGLGTAQILHHGYSKANVKDRNKIERNLNLLRKAVAENPDDSNLEMNLGLELVRSDSLDEGLQHYRTAFELMAAKPPGETAPELREALLTQFTCHLYKVRAHDEVAQVLTSPLARNGGLTASLHFALGLACFELGRYSEASEQMRQCLAKRQQPALSPINTDILTAAPYHCLALSLAKAGDPSAAEQTFQSGLGQKGRGDELRVAYAKFLVDQDRAVDALNRLHEAVTENAQCAAAWLLGAQIALSRADFLEVARDWTSEAVKHFPADAQILGQRAESLLLDQQTTEARELWRTLWDQQHQPRALAAILVCEIVEGRPITRSDAYEAELGPISRAFIDWYQRCLAMRAQPLITRLNERLDSLRPVLPAAAAMIESALVEAGQETAPTPEPCLA